MRYSSHWPACTPSVICPRLDRGGQLPDDGAGRWVVGMRFLLGRGGERRTITAGAERRVPATASNE